MRVSGLFGDTLRDAPADAELASHQLLLRAGYMRPLAAGIFSYLPLGRRTLHKLAAIIRAELDAIGGQEISMPVVLPADLWRESGRWESVGAELARFRDRGDRDMLLAMTHEEVVADLARREVRSYRALPRLVYQIQTRFRDEPRPRGGLIRMREFLMNDSYSLDRDWEGLQVQYESHLQAYARIYARCGLPVRVVESDTGMMGGRLAHEFQYLTPVGEDTLFLCPACGYAANREVAYSAMPAREATPQPLERVLTPNTPTIAALAAFLGIPASETGKVVFMWATTPAAHRGRLVLALVRGDMELNEVALARLVGATSLRTATADEIEACGAVPGYASPVGIIPGCALVVVDELVAATPNLVVGANEPGYHLRNATCGRDYQPDLVGRIALALEGAPCGQCGAALEVARGVEVGNIFQLGTRYADALGVTYLDEQGQERPVVMGSYGIGLDRLLACLAEHYRDAQGLALPIGVAPFSVALVALVRDPATRAAAEDMYAALLSAGVEVLYDDRDVRPGVKFADADLRGMPLRLTISERTLAQGGVELKARTVPESEQVALEGAVAAVQQRIAALHAAMPGA